MAAFKNFYQILDLPDFAGTAEVKAAFRKLARQFHPDLNANNRQAEEKFKEVNEAYETLNDPAKKAMHDAALKALKPKQPDSRMKTPASGGGAAKQRPSSPAKEAAKQSSKTPSEAKTGEAKTHKSKATPINELFESFLKKGFSDPSGMGDEEEWVFQPKSPRVEKPRRGEDVIVKTGVTPTEAAEGVVKTVNVQHNELCKRCSGTGKVSGAVCNACQGEKVHVRLKKIDVRIPAGVKTGSRVRVAREGGRGLGGAENGDLFLQIDIVYDPSLRIEGLDVFGEVTISVTEAVLGSEIEVPTLNGNVKMTVPPGTSPGKVFRLKERGVQSGSSKGDHLVTVTVAIPRDLSPRERELYQELARLRPSK